MGRRIGFVIVMVVACGPAQRPEKKVVADQPPPPEADQAAPTPAAPAAEEPGPFVWSVKKDGKEVHILGTMPVFAGELPELAGELLTGANVVGFERPPATSFARGKADMLDRSVMKLVGPERWKVLLEHAPLDTPAVLDKAHPGFLVRYLIRGRTEGIAELSAEPLLHDLSAKHGKKIRYAYPDRDMWLGSYYLANYERLVDELKRFLDDPEAVRAERDALLAAYRVGASEPLLRSREEAGSQWNNQLTFAAARMVENQLTKPETFVMVMNVRRVIGPFGVLAHLRDFGATVERIGAGTPATRGPAPPPRASINECKLYHFHRRSVLAMRGPVTWATLPRATDAERASVAARLQTPEAREDYIECKLERTWSEIRCALAARTPAALNACATQP